MSGLSVFCFSCGNEMAVNGHVGRRDECLKCGADLHVCKNCAHYDATAYNECREPSAEVVREKERSNFCGWFVTAQGPHSQEAAGTSAVDAAEALFRKK